MQSYPLVHAVLSSKSQEIYSELLRYVRAVLPLTYCDLTIITDFEYGLINAVKTIFPESKHQGCYFHFCQVKISCILRILLNLQILITINFRLLLGLQKIKEPFYLI